MLWPCRAHCQRQVAFLGYHIESGDIPQRYPPKIFIRVLKHHVGIMSSKYKKMQLDVDVSPPANIMTFRLTLTFDLNPCDLLGYMNYCPVNYYLVWFFVTTDRQTDAKQCIKNHSVVGKKCNTFSYFLFYS